MICTDCKYPHNDSWGFQKFFVIIIIMFNISIAQITVAYEYDQMRFTILEEIKSHFTIIIIHKSNQMLAFDERGKLGYPGKNLSWQSRDQPTNSIHICHRVQKSNPRHIGGRQVLSPLGQPCHQGTGNTSKQQKTNT